MTAGTILLCFFRDGLQHFQQPFTAGLARRPVKIHSGGHENTATHTTRHRRCYIAHHPLNIPANQLHDSLELPSTTVQWKARSEAMSKKRTSYTTQGHEPSKQPTRRRAEKHSLLLYLASRKHAKKRCLLVYLAAATVRTKKVPMLRIDCSALFQQLRAKA